MRGLSGENEFLRTCRNGLERVDVSSDPSKTEGRGRGSTPTLPVVSDCREGRKGPMEGQKEESVKKIILGVHKLGENGRQKVSWMIDTSRMTRRGLISCLFSFQTRLRF